MHWSHTLDLKRNVKSLISVAYFEQFEDITDGNETDPVGDARTPLAGDTARARAPNVLNMMTKQMVSRRTVLRSHSDCDVEEVESKQEVEMQPLLNADVNTQDLLLQSIQMQS
eukprot:13651_1